MYLVKRRPRTELDRVFDELLTPFEGLGTGRFGLIPFLRGWEGSGDTYVPSLDVAETEKEITVTADLPGMDEKDINVELDEDTLVIQGEKKEEHEEKDKHYHRVERRSGSFKRVIPLATPVDGEKVKASFKKGVLKVSLPKVEPEVKKAKKIEIK